jgi:hypothetical protein
MWVKKVAIVDGLPCKTYSKWNTIDRANTLDNIIVHVGKSNGSKYVSRLMDVDGNCVTIANEYRHTSTS